MRALVIMASILLLLGCDRSEPITTAAPIDAPGASKAAGTSPTRTEPSTDSPKKPLVLVGKITYGEDRYTRLSSPVQGRVLEVRATLGQQVRVGDVLMVIDSPDITKAYSDFVRETSELEFATRAYSLAKDLYEGKALAFKDLKQSENDLIKGRAEYQQAKERLLALRIPAAELEKPLAEQTVTARFEQKSPLTGMVTERTVTPGQLVGADPAQMLMTVADLDLLQVVADVYERDLGRISVGQPAIVSVEAYPGVEFPSTIATIGDRVDPDTRTIKVRAWVTNTDHKLKPEMFARLRLDNMAMGHR